MKIRACSDQHGGIVTKFLPFFVVIFLFTLSYGDTSNPEIPGNGPAIVNGIKVPVSLFVTSCLNSESSSAAKDNHKVRIVLENPHIQVHLTALDDYILEETKNGSQKTLYREQPQTAYFISKFESDNLVTICKYLLPVLENFEKSIRNKKWDQCRKFDVFLYRYIRGLYFAINVSRNHDDSRFQNAYIPDSLFDEAFDEERMYARNQMWQRNRDYTEKLLIVTNELINQIKVWQQISSKLNKDTNIENVAFSSALNIFIKIYYDNKAL